MAEAVTLAHVGRPLALARTLDRTRYEVHLACAHGYEPFVRHESLRSWPLHSISSEQFLAALAAGKPVYDAATLRAYVRDDLKLLREVKPDLVIGDFRLSLSVSARLAQIPYAGVINAYWSPYVQQHYSVPDIALARVLPITLADRLFRLVRPLAFALHSVPLNRVRHSYRLPSLGYDLRRIYTDADHVLYADVPEMFPPHGLPERHMYLGPVTWSPPVALPDWWAALPPERPVVYVTLGSSGQASLLPLVLQALAPLPLTVVAATAGKAGPGPVPANARLAAYLPGMEAARRSSLVICNGGSPTSQQALGAGVPVLGIAGNLDQFLNMHGVVAAGAGALLRADRLNEGRLRQTVEDLLRQPGPRAAAAEVARQFGRYDAGLRLGALLERVLGT